MTATSRPIQSGYYSSKSVVSGLSVPEHDYVSLSNYSGANPGTIVYRNGGVNGQVVATQTLTYDGVGNLISVSITRS